MIKNQQDVFKAVFILNLRQFIQQAGLEKIGHAQIFTILRATATSEKSQEST